MPLTFMQIYSWMYCQSMKYNTDKTRQIIMKLSKSKRHLMRVIAFIGWVVLLLQVHWTSCIKLVKWPFDQAAEALKQYFYSLLLSAKTIFMILFFNLCSLSFVLCFMWNMGEAAWCFVPQHKGLFEKSDSIFPANILFFGVVFFLSFPKFCFLAFSLKV